MISAESKITNLQKTLLGCFLLKTPTNKNRKGMKKGNILLPFVRMSGNGFMVLICKLYVFMKLTNLIQKTLNHELVMIEIGHAVLLETYIEFPKT